MNLEKGTPNRHLVLGKYLKSKRIASGLTQNDLAKVLGYSPQFVANWERGASSPPSHVMRKIVSLLKIPENEILALLYEQSMAYWREIILPTKKRRKSG